MRIRFNRATATTIAKADEVVHELDQDVAKMLRTSSASERELLEVVRAAGGDETVEKAAAAAARAVAAIRAENGGKVPEHVRKAVRGMLGLPQPTKSAPGRVQPQPTPPPTPRRNGDELLAEAKRFAKQTERSLDARAARDLEAAAERIRIADHRLTGPQAFAKALKENPDLYDRYRRHEQRKSGALRDAPSQEGAHD